MIFNVCPKCKNRDNYFTGEVMANGTADMTFENGMASMSDFDARDFSEPEGIECVHCEWHGFPDELEELKVKKP